MGLTRCNLNETDRVEAIRNFEEVLGKQGLSFINEIAVAPVSHIGVPNPFVLMKRAINSPGKSYIFLRLVVTILSIVLLLLTFEQYLLVSISLITSLIVYLWLDSVLIWFEKEKRKVSIKWFVSSLLVSLLMGLGTGPVIDTIIANLLALEPMRFWEFELLGISLILVISFFGAFASFKLYTGVAYFERTLFEDRFLAVRRCLRSRNRKSPFGESIDPIDDAIASETMFTILKYLVLMVVPLGLTYMWPFIFLLDLYPVPIFGISVIVLIVIFYMLNRIVKDGKILFRKAMSIQVGTITLAAIPLSILEPIFLWIGLYYILGTVLLVALWVSMRRVALDNPQVLGLPYFERQLSLYDGATTLEFVNQTIHQLEELYS